MSTRPSSARAVHWLACGAMYGEIVTHGAHPQARTVHIDKSPCSDELSSLLLLPPELLVVVLEQLSFDTLLAAHETCSRLREASLVVTRTHIDRVEFLTLPLIRPFGAHILCLELDNVLSEWLPRLSCVLAVMPRLQRLFIRRARTPSGFASFSSEGIVSLAGALQARACPRMHHLNIDERVTEDKVRLIVSGMRQEAALLFAASHGHERVVTSVLARGVDIETGLEDGATALLVASYHPCPGIVAKLLQAGASVHAQRSDGVTSLIMASNRGHRSNVDLLLKARAEVNVAMRDGTTALHTATYKGHVQVVQALIAAGAAVQSRCYDGVTALLMAAKSGREELVKRLRASPRAQQAFLV